MRFNGAVPFQARKSMTIPIIHASVKLQWGRAFSGTEISCHEDLIRHEVELQWGRAFSGTEIKSDGYKKLRIRHASMGPCLFRHGNHIRPLVE